MTSKAGLVWPKDADRKQRSADRPDDGMDGVPGRVDPRDFVGEKFQEIERTGNPKNERIAQDGERLVGRTEDDPMLVDRQAGHKNRQIKIETSEAGQAERDTEELQLIHAELCGHAVRSHALFCKRRELPTRHPGELVPWQACADRVKSRMLVLHCPMLDIRLIREQPDFVKSRLATAWRR